MKDQGDGRAGARPRMKTAFQASLGTGEYDFGLGLRLLA